MDESYKMWALAIADAHANEGPPATDRERLEWLDQVAPVVNPLPDYTYSTTT